MRMKKRIGYFFKKEKRKKRILCKFTLTTENYFNYRELTVAYHVVTIRTGMFRLLEQ